MLLMHTEKVSPDTPSLSCPAARREPSWSIRWPVLHSIGAKLTCTSLHVTLALSCKIPSQRGMKLTPCSRANSQLLICSLIRPEMANAW